MFILLINSLCPSSTEHESAELPSSPSQIILSSHVFTSTTLLPTLEKTGIHIYNLTPYLRENRYSRLQPYSLP